MIKAGKLAAIEHGKRSWIARAELHDYVAREAAAAAKRRAENAKSQRPSRPAPPSALGILGGVVAGGEVWGEYGPGLAGTRR